MPITLVLHIGLALFLVQTLENPDVDRQKKQILCGGAVLALVFLFVAALDRYGAFDLEQRAQNTSVYQAAGQLMLDVPDNEQVAAHDSAAWPIVAVGQRVVSIPWPEPMIHDAAMRQAAIRHLFDATLTQAEREDAARRLGVRILVVDKRLIAAPTLAVIQKQIPNSQQVGTMVRFDIFD